MDYAWLLPLLAAAAALLALFLSRPERRQLAVLAAISIVLYAAWQAQRDFVAGRAQRQIQYRIYDRLSVRTHGFLNSLATVVIRGSGGFVPDSDEEFFSPELARILCSETNVREPSLGIPIPLYDHLAPRAEGYREFLSGLLDDHAEHLDADLLAAASAVESSRLLGILEAAPHVVDFDREHEIERAPLLCWGLEPLVEDSLLELRELVTLMRKGEERFAIDRVEDWLNYPPHYLEQYQGLNRFSPEQLTEFQASHPNAPGPVMFGKGMPSKTPVFDPRSSRGRQN